MSELKSSNLFQRILTAVIVLPAVIAGIALFPQRGPWIVAAILCVLCMGEAHSLLAKASLDASHIAFMPGIALFLEMAGMPNPAVPLPMVGLPIVATVAAALVLITRADRLGVKVLAADGAGALCGLVIGLGAGAFAGLSRLAPVQEGTARIAFLLAVVISCDVFAYFVGRSIGKRKLAPTVSPGKTIEGAIGGLVGAAIASAVIANQFFNTQPIAVVVAMGVLVAIAGIAGDLLESLFKRYVGAKDSGTIFPGHGGALDRMDAFLLAAPLLYAFFKTVG